jgi:Tetracyclin repressor-like, C-terminal domain
MFSTNLDVLRVNEAMLAILLTGGIEPGTAAWAIDALSLYVSAYTLEISLVTQRRSHQDDSWVLGRDELVRRLTALPADQFPQTRRYAAELTSGTGHERFDFTLSLIVDNLAQRRPTPRD